ncbi:MAG: TonB-dependent receptor, partial [Alistipes sp.]
MSRLVGCLVVALLLSSAAAAQEPAYYTYETESEQNTSVLLTDSVLFYRAIQSSSDLYAAMTDYNLSFVRMQRRGQGYDLRTIEAEGVAVPLHSLAALRSLGAVEQRFAGLAMTGGSLGLTQGVRVYCFDEGEPLSARRASVSFADRNYLVSAKLSYAAPIGRGWNLSAALDLRTGRDRHVEGVFTNAATGALRVEKQFAGGARLSLLALVPPSMRGLRSTSTEEAFRLTGDRLYNPAWGFQSGRVRNAHIRRDFLPLVITHAAVPLSAATELAVTLGVEAGVSKYSTLGWYDARTPLPDNYRSLPSYTGDRETDEAWRRGDPRYTQVDWDELYAENRMAHGEAVYALEDRVRRSCNGQLNVQVTTRVDDRLTLYYGIAAHRRSERHYKQMRDLLGGEFRTDIDQYLVDDDTYNNLLQNDLRHPNRRVGVGDRFGYDYALTSGEIGVRVVAQYRADRLRADVGAEIGDASVRRRGYFEKELFAGRRSYGRSAVLHFSPYRFKLAAGWSFSPKSYIGGVLMVAATAPDADDLFLQPQYNNRAVDAPALRRVWAAEMNYHFTNRTLDLRATTYIIWTRDALAAARYYDDLAGAFCNLSASGIDTRSYGVEVATAIRLNHRWRLSVAAAAGVYEYASDPRVSVVKDADNAAVDLCATSHMGGCRVGNAPQLSACAELGYFGAHGWGFRATFSGIARRFVEPTLLRRTERVARQAAAAPEAFDRLMQQEQLDDAVRLDASVFKTFYVGDSRLTLSIMVRNLVGSSEVVYAAYESLRVRRLRSGDFVTYAPFESRRTYAYPRT